MVCLLELHEDEGMFDLIVRRSRVELVVEVAEVEASTKVTLQMLQHWLQLEKLRRVIWPGSC